MEKILPDTSQTCLAIVGKDKCAVASVAGYIYAKYAVVPQTLSSDPKKRKSEMTTSSAFLRDEDFRVRRPRVKFGEFPITMLTARSVQRSIDAIAHSQATIIVMSLLAEKYRMKEAAREALSLISCAYHMKHEKVVLVIYWDSNLKVTEWLTSTFIDLKSMLVLEMKALGLDFNMPIIPASCEFLELAHNIDGKNEEFTLKYEDFSKLDAEHKPLLEHFVDFKETKLDKDILDKPPLLKVIYKYSDALVAKLVQGTLEYTDSVFLLPPVPKKQSNQNENKELPLQIVRIEHHGQKVEKAFAGQFIGIEFEKFDEKKIHLNAGRFLVGA